MPGVVTLELAATRAAQRVQVDTQTPPSVSQEEELEPEEIRVCPADSCSAADAIRGWREDVERWES